MGEMPVHCSATTAESSCTKSGIAVGNTTRSISSALPIGRSRAAAVRIRSAIWWLRKCSFENRVAELNSTMTAEHDSALNVDHFLGFVRKHAGIQALTAEMIREFVKKILVYKAERVDGKRVQRIKIVRNCISEFIPPAITEQKSGIAGTIHTNYADIFRDTESLSTIKWRPSMNRLNWLVAIHSYRIIPNVRFVSCHPVSLRSRNKTSLSSKKPIVPITTTPNITMSISK